MSDGSHLTARMPPEGGRHHLLVDVVGGGRRELLTVVREQLVSRVRHRYGYVAVGLSEMIEVRPYLVGGRRRSPPGGWICIFVADGRPVHGRWRRGRPR